jgi:hypothetical protein
LPQEALEGQAQAVDAITAVEALVLAGEQWDGQQIAEVFLKLVEGGLAQGLRGPATQGSQARAEGWKIRSNQHRAVYIPPY